MRGRETAWGIGVSIQRDQMWRVLDLHFSFSNGEVGKGGWEGERVRVATENNQF